MTQVSGREGHGIEGHRHPGPDGVAAPRKTDRTVLLDALARLKEVDLVVIGGGASGLGVALDARLRGLSVLLLESHDFAGGTSSRATKLAHGGVRYLAQGNIGLVREALHERQAMLANAPHLAQPLAFVMPAYRAWQLPFYGIGLKAYDALSGSASLGTTRWLGHGRVLRALPGVNPRHLVGGVQYWDGQFDDARLALALARTAASEGALVLNYCPVTGILHGPDGRACGVRWRDGLGESGSPVRFGEVRARCVVNATGVWVDAVRRLDNDTAGRQTRPMVAPSQGVHLVVDRSFLPSAHALLIPHTHDGRVLFAVPWMGHLILGTTDTPRTALEREPRPLPEEVRFILTESARYLSRAPQAGDILSLWAGLRPLVRPAHDEGEMTKSISREHTVRMSASGMVTVTGGKWTTYRAMADDVLKHCEAAGILPKLPECRTAHFALVGGRHVESATPLSAAPGLHLYGDEADAVATLPGHAVDLGLGLTESMVRFAARYEYACCVEDVLARRHRMLFVHAEKAAAAAPRVAEILHEELGHDAGLPAFLDRAAAYRGLPAECVARTKSPR